MSAEKSVEEKRLDGLRTEGGAAFYFGLRRCCNPYPVGSLERKAWVEGWVRHWKDWRL